MTRDELAGVGCVGVVLVLTGVLIAIFAGDSSSGVQLFEWVLIAAGVLLAGWALHRLVESL